MNNIEPTNNQQVNTPIQFNSDDDNSNFTNPPHSPNKSFNFEIPENEEEDPVVAQRPSNLTSNLTDFLVRPLNAKRRLDAVERNFGSRN